MVLQLTDLHPSKTINTQANTLPFNSNWSLRGALRATSGSPWEQLNPLKNYAAGVWDSLNAPIKEKMNENSTVTSTDNYNSQWFLRWVHHIWWLMVVIIVCQFIMIGFLVMK